MDKRRRITRRRFFGFNHSHKRTGFLFSGCRVGHRLPDRAAQLFLRVVENAVAAFIKPRRPVAHDFPPLRANDQAVSGWQAAARR